VKNLDENKELRLILSEIAHKNGVTLEQVEQDIQDAIDGAWDNPDFRERQKKLFPDGKPTIEEFIMKMSQFVKEASDTDD